MLLECCVAELLKGDVGTKYARYIVFITDEKRIFIESGREVSTVYVQGYHS